MIDNFFYEKNSTENVNFIKLQPKLNIQTQFERHLIQLLTETEHVSFQKFSQDNYSNFRISPSYQYKLATNQTLFVNALLKEQYEARGTGLTLGNAQSLSVGDTKRNSKIHGGLLYGSKDSVAKLSLTFGQEHNRYTTRRELTNTLDKESVFINPSFDYLIGGASYLSTELKAEQITYKRNEALSKNKYVGLIGFKWQPSSITDLALLLGYQEIQFEQSALANDTAFKWRVNVGWQPLEGLAFTLLSERDFSEANKLQDSYRLVDNTILTIRKTWNDYFDIKASFGYSTEDVISQFQLSTEDYFTTQVSMNYQRNSWLSLYFKYDYKGLDASITELEYQRNSLSLGFTVRL
ncbi:hypothetical protein GCM10011501_34950 [Thalassotalea profundi]|uniref:DUF560 domain-containing protein n=2 Tax=Thalassotalea profundi TaxID=2036687 RepID=A0ABQ3J368_9GAMM|nr:hypothetical protein GCM10011501_34950 [Thalassotalea profundi]